MRTNQLLRALRVDKFTLGVLDQLLSAYFKNDAERTRLMPTHRYLKMTPYDIETKVDDFMSAYVEPLAQLELRVEKTQMDSEVGAGSMPLKTLPSVGLKIQSNGSIDKCLRAMRMAKRPLIGRIEKDAIILDFRMIEYDDFEAVYEALKAGCYHA
jgi:L-seryl-tRNA(Ser) seleniumtransferase